MEWFALLAFLLCLVYLPKFRKVMMWIGIVGGGLGAVGLGAWKIKDHYDQKRVAEQDRQYEEKHQEIARLQNKARDQGLTDNEMARLEALIGFVPDPVQPKGAIVPDPGSIVSPPTKRLTLTPEDLEGATVVQPAPKPFDPDKYLREKAAQRKRQAKKSASDWEVVPDPKAP